MHRSSDETRGRVPPAIRACRFPQRCRSALLFLGVSGLILLGTQLGRQVWGVQTSSTPSVLRPAPGFKGVAVSLPRGEVLVLRLLQDLANYIGEPVYADGDIHPAAKITLEGRPTRLDVPAATRLLAGQDYSLSRESFRGEKVYWVQKLLVLKRKKGGLRPAGSLARERDAGDARVAGVDQGRDAVGGSLCLYGRQDGDGARYVVLFETSSKEAAEDALSLLQAHRRSREAAR